MTVIYQGSGISEYHLDSGQVITLNEQEAKDLLSFKEVDIEEMEADIREMEYAFNNYSRCEELLSNKDIDDFPTDFIKDVIDELKMFKKDNEDFPTINDVLCKLKEEKEEVSDEVENLKGLIKYLYEFIEDESK